MILSGVFLTVAPVVLLYLSRASNRPFLEMARSLVDYTKQQDEQARRGREVEVSAPAPHFDTDLLVIGGGSGGVRAARMAAARGARVTLVEAGGTAGLGGTCVNVGCIPKKLYSYAAHYAEAFEESHGFGWQGAAPRFDWARLKENRRNELARLNGVYLKLLVGSGVEVINGRARLLDAHTVEIDGSAHGSGARRAAQRAAHPDRHRRAAAGAGVPGPRARADVERDVRPRAVSRRGCW